MQHIDLNNILEKVNEHRQMQNIDLLNNILEKVNEQEMETLLRKVLAVSEKDRQAILALQRKIRNFLNHKNPLPK